MELESGEYVVRAPPFTLVMFTVSLFLRARTNANPTRKSSRATTNFNRQRLQRLHTNETLCHANRNHGLDDPECAMLRQEEDRYAAMLPVVKLC